MWSFAAVFCDSLMQHDENTAGTNSSDTPITPDGYPYMTATIYWCLEGRKFEDGLKTRTLYCVGNGHWGYPSVDCHCTLYWLVLHVSGAGFSLSRALFRKNAWAPHLGRQTLFFLGKNWRPFLVITVCQLSVLRPYLFSPEKLVITVAFIHSFTRLSPIVSGMLLCCKKFAAPLVGALFCGAPVRLNMLNMPKSAAACITAAKHCFRGGSRSGIWGLMPRVNAVQLNTKDV